MGETIEAQVGDMWRLPSTDWGGKEHATRPAGALNGWKQCKFKDNMERADHAKRG